ncbi:MAG: radical SAM protein [Nitrospirae bacterium]|nr:radical SAM protein [Nitrospirota bacterium]
MNTSVPEYIQFFPTLECNLHCGFCFNRGLKIDGAITAGGFEKLVRKLVDSGIREIDILGGEPTLHPDIARLVDIAANLGLRLNLSTNGTNVALLANLSETYGKDILHIGISLNSNSMTRELEDYISKYRPVLKSIYNRTSIPRPSDICSGTPGITYYLLYMDTVTEYDLTESLPFHDFFKRLSVFREKHPNISGVYCGGFLPDPENNPLLKNVRCPAGTTKLSILPDGSVYPCYLLFRHHEFMLGNIFTDRFDVIWNKPALDYFRTFKGNKCPDTECDLFSECHGGCPAVSLLISNDINAPDPRCIRQ